MIRNRQCHAGSVLLILQQHNTTKEATWHLSMTRFPFAFFGIAGQSCLHVCILSPFSLCLLPLLCTPLCSIVISLMSHLPFYFHIIHPFSFSSFLFFPTLLQPNHSRTQTGMSKTDAAGFLGSGFMAGFLAKMATMVRASVSLALVNYWSFGVQCACLSLALLFHWLFGAIAHLMS